MLSKMITRRQKSASEVEVAIQRYGSEAASAAGRALEPYLKEGETLPDLELLQHLFRRALNDHHGRIIASDEVRLAGLRRTIGPRSRRDVAAKVVAEKLFQLRDVFSGCFGEQTTAELLGIEGALDQDPVALSRIARRAVGVLRSDSLEMPAYRISGASFDFDRWAEDLEAPLQELETALGEVLWERKGAEHALLAKHDAMKAYDRLFMGVARLQEALFRFAGLSGLADRVRPSVRRPGLTHEVAGPERASPPPEETESLAEPQSEAGPGDLGFGGFPSPDSSP